MAEVAEVLRRDEFRSLDAYAVAQLIALHCGFPAADRALRHDLDGHRAALVLCSRVLPWRVLGLRTKHEEVGST